MKNEVVWYQMKTISNILPSVTSSNLKHPQNIFSYMKDILILSVQGFEKLAQTGGGIPSPS